MSFTIVIPARYASSRLPGKPLVDIHGKTMLARVISRSLLSKPSSVIVATDDERIAAEATASGAEVCMTSENHQSGTDRLTEVVEKYGFEDDHVIVNVQGDEPFIDPEHIIQVARDLADHKAEMATLATPITHMELLQNPNVVKTVLDEQGYALYFSRATIPYAREGGVENLLIEKIFLRHIGLYAYTAGFLRKYATWKPSPLEEMEKLEQLRVLWYGRKIHVSVTETGAGISVDTPADLEQARKAFLLDE